MIRAIMVKASACQEEKHQVMRVHENVKKERVNRRKLVLLQEGVETIKRMNEKKVKRSKEEGVIFLCFGFANFFFLNIVHVNCKEKFRY